MKASLLIFCTLFVIENFVIANNEFPKSELVKDFFHKKKQQQQRLINGPKLLNKKFSKTKLLEPRTKKHLDDAGYTVFPSPAKKPAAINVPSSPYFSGDPHNDEPKLRVKKVLPDFWNVHDRKKRSPDEKAAAKAEDKKSGDTKATPAKTDVKETKKVEQPVAKGVPSGDTKKESESRRLIAARDGLIENYPYVVSIQKDGEHWCAGAILNQRLIITTANCVWKSSRMSRMMIRAGSRHLEHGGQVVAISEVLKHPGWSIRKNPDFDIALLLTSDFIKFSHSCHAVDLPNRVMMPIFDDAWVTSWGADRRDGVYISKQGLTLQIYHGRLMSREKCNNITMRFGVMVTENFICLEQIGRRSPCTRDTGAPAVSDGVLWGLASWGIRKMCGTERFPAMFSYVASQTNMDFILNGTRYMMSEERLNPFPDRYPFQRARNNSILRI